MAPISAMGIVGNPDLKGVAKEADERLRRVVGTLEKQFAS
jgi:hypothetical protein